MRSDLVSVSKLLSRVLRHDPGLVGVRLDPAGWVEVNVLLDAVTRHGTPISRGVLDRVIAGTDKRRFELRDGRIRAAQGHSVDVDLGLPATAPPDILYHGTVARFLGRILDEGLRPMRRSHVHLSRDLATAHTVGARRGAPVILEVDAAGMHHAGSEFHLAANGVWLTRQVRPRWIRQLS